MTEHPNSILMQQCLQAIHAGDRQTLRCLWADDIVWHVKSASPHQGEIKGPDDIFEYLADLGDVGRSGFNTQIEDVMVSGRRAAVICHCEAESNDRSLDANFLLVAKIVNRRIQEVMSVPLEPDHVEAFWSNQPAEPTEPNPDQRRPAGRSVQPASA